MNQDKLLTRIRKLSARIADLRASFALPKEDKARFDTYGGALALQKAKEERKAAQGQLDPMRLIATGVSCRDCLHFAHVDSPMCWRFGMAKATKNERAHGGDCGPNAELFIRA